MLLKRQTMKIKNTILRKTPLEAWIKSHIGLNIEEPFTRKILEEHQLIRLKKIADKVKNFSRFYNEKLAGFSSEELHHISDITKLPFTASKDVAGDPFAFSCVTQSDISRVMTVPTSGTTGNPKKIFYTEADQEATIDFFHYGMSCVTEPGSRVLILLPGELPGSVGDLLRKGLSRLGAEGIKHGLVQDPLKTLEAIRKNHINSVVGFPVQVLSLAAHPETHYYIKDEIKSVLLVSDYVPDSIMERIKDAWDCEIFQHYGMTETGLGGGVQCEAHRGYHMREADLLCEIIDPETQLPVADGEFGEVVFTSLTAQGTPLIRYRTGDISRFLPEPCPCGSVLKSIEKIRGRLLGGIVLGDGRLELRELDEVLFHLDEVLNFRAEFRDEHGKDIIELEIYAPNLESGSAELVHSAVRKIPLINRCVDNRTLNIEINITKERINTGALKRTMRDLRGRNISPEIFQGM
jgi:phenylacetate-CoA ligase